MLENTNNAMTGREAYTERLNKGPSFVNMDNRYLTSIVPGTKDHSTSTKV